MRLKDTGFKILLVLFALVPLTGCNNSRMDFEVALKYTWRGSLSEEAGWLVDSLNDWEILHFGSPYLSQVLGEALDESNQRYDEDFFINNALIVFTFGVNYGGITFHEIHLRNRGAEIILEVTVEQGVTTAPTFGIIILEISNENISETTILSVNLNVLDANIPG